MAVQTLLSIFRLCSGTATATRLLGCRAPPDVAMLKRRLQTRARFYRTFARKSSEVSRFGLLDLQRVSDSNGVAVLQWNLLLLAIGNFHKYLLPNLLDDWTRRHTTL